MRLNLLSQKAQTTPKPVIPTPQPPESRYPHVQLEALNCSVLFGATSSVLKSIMSEHHGLKKDDSKVIILPPVLFDGERSYGDLEFLVYYNAFVKGNLFKGRPIQVVGHEAHCEAMKEFLRTTVFGPDWSNQELYPFVPDRERRFYAAIAAHYSPKDAEGKQRSLEDYVQFIPFNNAGFAKVSIEGDDSRMLLIEDALSPQRQAIQGAAGYDIRGYVTTEQGSRQQVQAFLPLAYNHPPSTEIPLPVNAAKEIHSNRYGFAVTCLGNSTGFDEQGLVTSFIIWLGGTGILVDPSEDALRKIEELGLSSYDTPYCLLTHCHQDHDGGLLSYMLHGKAITLLAPRIVYEEFMSKAGKLLQFQPSKGEINPRNLVHWMELEPEKEITIKTRIGEDATFQCWRNLHPIPTDGFSVEFLGKRFGHSGDTQWSPKLIRELVANHVLTVEEGIEQLSLFFRDGKPNFDLLHMEAGAGVIHTDVRDIAEAVMPEERGKIFLYHVPDSALPKDTGGLRKIRLGETQRLVAPSSVDTFIGQKALIADNPYFSDLTEAELVYLMSRVRERTFKPGTMLFEEGASVRPGDKIYFITKGCAAIGASDREIRSGGCVGDWAILTGHPRSTTVFAKGPESLGVLEMSQKDFRYLMNRGRGFEAVRKQVEVLLEHSTLFDSFFRSHMGRIPDDSIKALIGLIAPHMEKKTFEPGSLIFQAGDMPDDGVLLVSEGYCSVVTAEGNPAGLVRPGELAGEIGTLRSEPRSATVVAGEVPVSGLRIQKDAFLKLVAYYPALRNGLMQLMNARLHQLNAA